MAIGFFQRCGVYAKRLQPDYATNQLIKLPDREIPARRFFERLIGVMIYALSDA